jgi:hypothetical protein
MNRMKRFALNVVVMAGMTLAMSSLGLAQQETIPDQFLGLDEIRAAQPVAQQKDKSKVQLANSHRQAKTRNHKRLAKQTSSDNPTVTQARK